MAPEGEGEEAVALISGGKDSLLALYHAAALGYRIVALANLHPPIAPSPATATAIGDGVTVIPPTAVPVVGPAAAASDEMDSHMYQTVGHTLLPLYAACLGLPLYRRAIAGQPLNAQLDYQYGGGNDGDSDETEDLTALLRAVLRAHPRAVAVTSGAISSSYQRTRIESVCTRLGLRSVACLWLMPQERVLAQLASLGVDARIVKVACMGLDATWLWRNVADAGVRARLGALHDRWGINPAGEGGEYETLVVDAPGWRGRIAVADPAGSGDGSGGDSGMEIVADTGGAAWLRFTATASVVMRHDDAGGDGDGDGDGDALREAAQPLASGDILEPAFAALLASPSLPDPPPPRNGPSPSPPPPHDGESVAMPEPVRTSTGISNLCSPQACETLADEVAAIFASLARMLHPLPLAAVTSATVLLRRMDDFAAVNALYAPHFSHFPLPPSRVCVAVSGLPARRNLMLHANFCPPPTVAQQQQRRRGLYVQSRSHWAPANIGPYSQAVHNARSGQWEVAGQIPLVPATMALADGCTLQAVLALQHLFRVWRAVDGGQPPRVAVAWVLDECMVPCVLGAWHGRPGGGGGGGGGESGIVVVQATGLPRGACVEWVGFGPRVTVSFGGRDGDGTGDENAEQEQEGEMTVYTAHPIATQSPRARARLMPVGGVWDHHGRSRSRGVVLREVSDDGDGGED